MYIKYLYKTVIISVTVIRSFGLAGHSVRSTLANSFNRENSNVSVANEYYNFKSSEKKGPINKTSLPFDLESNSSYVYAVIVSPDYDDTISNIDYTEDYPYIGIDSYTKPLLTMKKRRRRLNPYRFHPYKYYRQTYRDRIRSSYTFSPRLLAKKINNTNRRIYGHNENNFISSILPITSQPFVRRKTSTTFIPEYTNFVNVADRSTRYISENSFNNARLYSDDYEQSAPVSNRRHQNYQNSIVTGSRSSGLTWPLLGLFGVLQLMGIIFNIGLGKINVEYPSIFFSIYSFK